MKVMQMQVGAFALSLFALAIMPGQSATAEQVASPPAPTIAKMCSNCHKAASGNLRGEFDSVAFKAKAIQLEIDATTEILKFDEASLKVVEGDKTLDAEALHKLKKGHALRIEYTEKDRIKTATLVSIKPPVKVAPEKLISFTKLQKLVELGPEKGNYTLVDSRPAPRFKENAIPTAISIPYPEFDKYAERLPKDKKSLVIFYCSGLTCVMSPNSMRKAEQLGYTNVKVYREGIPDWSQKTYSVVSAKQLKEIWFGSDYSLLLLDVRPAKEVAQGFIKRAVAIPAGQIKLALKDLPDKRMKPPIIIYDGKGGSSARTAAAEIIAAGYSNVILLTGGMEAWRKAKYPLATGKPAAKIVYEKKLRPGEIAVEEFRKIAENNSGNALILDVRNPDEAKEGIIKGARFIPVEEILNRLAELPKDKLIVTHCNTGVRAEMAYHMLKDLGYNVKFLNATVEVDPDGTFEIICSC